MAALLVGTQQLPENDIKAERHMLQTITNFSWKPLNHEA